MVPAHVGYLIGAEVNHSFGTATNCFELHDLRPAVEGEPGGGTLRQPGSCACAQLRLQQGQGHNPLDTMYDFLPGLLAA